MPEDPNTPAEPIEPQEPVEPVEPQEPAEPIEPGELEKPVTMEDMKQFMGSWAGRIEKNLGEKFTPQPQASIEETPPPGKTVIDKFNDEIGEMFYSGNHLGAFQKMQAITDKTKANITQGQITATDRAITAYSEDPDYKEIFTDVQKAAHIAVKNGYPAEAAAKSAFNEVKVAHLQKKISGDSPNLDMLAPGKPSRGTKTSKLPPEFQLAMERDIRDGVVKDEKEYRTNLTPAIKEKYNIK